MPVSRRKLAMMALGLSLPSPLLAQAQAQTPSTALPGAHDPNAIPLLTQAKTPDAEQWENFMDSRIVRNVTAPTLTPFLPDPAKANGAAVVVAPGGAFMMLSIDNEGYEVARWLAAHGIAAFVLKYRLKPTPRDTPAFMGQLAGLLNNAGKTSDNLSTPPEALADAKAAIRLVRQRAAAWHVDPHRVGLMGFSAGAMTTISTGLDPDTASRPNFIAPIYGPLSSRAVPADAPPMFTAMAMDDPIFSRSDLGFLTAYRAAGRPVEAHLYESGGHGFGMRKQGKSSDLWIEQFLAWAQDRSLLNPAR